MKTSRRGFFASLAAIPVIAKYLPQALKPKMVRPRLMLNDVRNYDFLSHTHKIGDTIHIRKPARFIGKLGPDYDWNLAPPVEFETRTITSVQSS